MPVIRFRKQYGTIRPGKTGTKTMQEEEKMAEKKRKGLHKGIETFFQTPNAGLERAAKGEEKKEDTKAAAVMVRITKIEPNRSQPRKVFDEEKLNELSESIRQLGVLEPILVQEKGDHYEIIAGERRWRAARQAGLTEMPAIIRNYSEREIVEVSLIENIQRADLNAIEEAEAYRRLTEEFGLTQEEVAKRVSKNRATITNSLRLLKLSQEVREMLIAGSISPGHARTLVSVEDEERQLALAKQVAEEHLSVRELEKLVKEPVRRTKPPKEKDHSLELIYRELEERMKRGTGTKVSIVPSGKSKGRVQIEYYSHDDLERISELLSR